MIRVFQFERSLDHFALSVKVNPLQIGTWFTYGCAALACAQYKTAAIAFRQCVNMDNDVSLSHEYYIHWFVESGSLCLLLALQNGVQTDCKFLAHKIVLFLYCQDVLCTIYSLHVFCL